MNLWSGIDKKHRRDMIRENALKIMLNRLEKEKIELFRFNEIFIF